MTASSESPTATSAPVAHADVPERAPGVLGRALCLDDFEHLARWRLPRPIYGYVSGGVETNASMHANLREWNDYSFVPRVLVDTTSRSLATTLLGRRYDAPFGIAPMGGVRLSAYRGDVKLARAAASARIPMALSGAALTPLEEIVRVNPDAWFQAYIPGNERVYSPLIERVERAGYQTLVVTVDVQVNSNREHNVRTGFTTPLRPSLRLAWDGLVRPHWLFGNLLRTLLTDGMPYFENMGPRVPMLSTDAKRDHGGRDSLSWKHLEAIRRRWKGKLIIKGVLHPEDARLARETGLDGIVVSNHGGRQLDGSATPLAVLPAIAAQAGDMAVMMDSGVRRGSDVLKALALGAQFVFVGRPFQFAVAVAGEAGVGHAIRLLREEIDRNLAMMGILSPRDMRREFLLPAPR